MFFQNSYIADISWGALLLRLLSLLCILLTLFSPVSVVARSNSDLQLQGERSLLTALAAAKTTEESRVLVRSHKNFITEKLWTMLKEEIDKNFSAEEYRRASFLAEIGKQIAEELNNRRWLILTLNRIAYIHLMLGDYHQASESGMQCLAAMDGLDDKLILANVLLTSIGRSRTTGCLLISPTSCWLRSDRMFEEKR